MSMSPFMTRLMARSEFLSDFSVVVIILLAVLMMVLPLPPVVVDVLIGLNIAVTALVLMVTLNIERPVEFATLPSVILMVTVFRMAIEVATSRSILVEADAGEIVNTFGEFVISGNLLAGIVSFLIITIVQFLVITKGSERVAEVAARFTLDAMPGKQLSIDSDLRNGDITQADAMLLRRLLAQESQLYGSMDGAMKFVKGDAIAGLAIVMINLVGGIIIGTVQRGLSLADAVHTYSLLTVGSGLISQIPSLFMSIASGVILTRVSGGDSRRLGSEIVQEFSKPRALGIASLMLAMMTVVPGFPALTFAALALLMGGAAALIARQRKDSPAERRFVVAGGRTQAAGKAAADGKAADGKPTIPVVLRLGSDLFLGIPDLNQRVVELGKHLERDLGIAFPAVQSLDDPVLPTAGYMILIDNLPAGQGEMPLGQVWVKAQAMDVDLLDLPWEEKAGRNVGDPVEIWADAGKTEALDKAGLAWAGVTEILMERVMATLRRNAAQFLGIQEAKNLLAGMEAASYEDLVREANRAVPLQRFTEVLKRLLDEQVSVSNMRLILEALVEWGPKEQDPALLAEYVRGSLKRQISYAHADPEKLIAVILLQRETEDLLRAALRKTAVGTYLTLSDGDTMRLLEQIRAKRPVSQFGAPPVAILTSLDIRRFLRSFVVRNDLDVPVLSFQDIAPDYVVRPIATIAFSGNQEKAEASSKAAPVKTSPVPQAAA